LQEQFPQWRIERDQTGDWRATRGDALPVELMDSDLRREVEAESLFELGEYLQIQARLLKRATERRESAQVKAEGHRGPRVTWEQVEMVVDRWEFMEIALVRAVAVRRDPFSAAGHAAGCARVVVASTVEQLVERCVEQEHLAGGAG
jgi:hypothetical protein